MATKSFLKTVNLQSKKQCQAFIRAVERSQQSSIAHTRRDDPEQYHARDLTTEQIRKVFCDNKPIEEVQ